jgi:hypothetical protein
MSGKPAENLRQLAYFHPALVILRPLLLRPKDLGALREHSCAAFTEKNRKNAKSRAQHTSLPRRLRNSRNLSAQRQLPETQAANAELAQISARTSANAAAVMLPRRELGLLYFVLV